MCCLPNDVILVRADFTGDTSYPNKVMKGMRYRLVRDGDVVMTEGMDYDDKTGGGFDLTSFQMADDTRIMIQFY